MSGRTKKFIDKNKAQNFAVVYRSHEDSKYYDEEASAHVLVPIEKKRENKNVKSRKQLELELQAELDDGKIRKNEGEAALYGITYDDSNYDYMQHLKPIGDGHGVFIAKNEKPDKKKIGEVSFFEDINDNDVKKEVNYQDMQDIQDDIKGFKPGMDPRLREVLEALEDEEYVEDDKNNDDLFGDLLNSGEKSDVEKEEVDEWDLDNFDDTGYNTDEFEKPGDQGWEADFRKFQHHNKNVSNDWDSDNEFEDEQDDITDLPDIKPGKKVSNSKQRKKKGTMTDTSSFSMSSSALFRSEGLTLLDDRFEKMQINYEDENEDEYKEFDMKSQRQDFSGMLDDFLDNYELEKGGRKLVKKDETRKKIQQAADLVSRGKSAARRRAKK